MVGFERRLGCFAGLVLGGKCAPIFGLRLGCRLRLGPGLQDRVDVRVGSSPGRRFLCIEPLLRLRLELWFGLGRGPCRRSPCTGPLLRLRLGLGGEVIDGLVLGIVGVILIVVGVRGR